MPKKQTQKKEKQGKKKVAAKKASRKVARKVATKKTIAKSKKTNKAVKSTLRKKTKTSKQKKTAMGFDEKSLLAVSLILLVAFLSILSIFVSQVRMENEFRSAAEKEAQILMANSSSEKTDGQNQEVMEAWRTFRNDKLGCEIKSPKDWEFSEVNVIDTNKEKRDYIVFTSPDEEVRLYFDARKKGEDSPLGEFVKLSVGGEMNPKGEIEIASKKARIFEWLIENNWEGFLYQSPEKTYLEIDDLETIAYLEPPNGEVGAEKISKASAKLDTANKILSSFRLID